jgi:methylated-DNA-protein-cysteine methyltransferase-like protein
MAELTFYEMVYQVVRLIPKGRVTSYGAIAKSLGSGGSSRMVGYAMNNAHGMHPPVPAHRVVNRNGLLTGKFHFSPPELMQQLLESEGLIIIDDKIQNFKKHYWDPLVEI